ncbi:hypothetical protein [Streptomyces sp. NBC_00094]|uniref:hypothetical protein n=1 Tax=Streptomyces sp. NBC_00094 TaxID=2903620 RepID=UPI002258DAA0|nr:hypothetical protein [Streptomyces sp. NBC_00094]MCX5395113.1 hypothetical protein [Streptomyces sp. NBC_00094]
MGGTDPNAEAGAAGDAEADADALFVLTAALLTPARFPSVLGDDYPAACAALGLQPYADGYGLVFGQDGLGARWTVVVDDVSLVAVAISSWDCGMAYDLSPDENSVVAGLPGWPLALATAAPGVPAPHDPEPEEGDPAPLVPPSGDEWGPAQRRLGADEVALQWAAWRAQVNDETPGDGAPGAASGSGAASHSDSGAASVPIPGTASDPGSGTASAPESGPAPDAGASASPAAVPDPYDGVRKALSELRGYLEEPPPVGRVRSAGGAEGGARMLRADGPGWSLVARTDDMAFVLLDELPREVLPVARGPRLPSLLDALDAMAVRPS